MSLKPKIGILFFTSGWFRNVGLQKSDSSITEDINKIAEEIITRITRFSEPVYKGVVYSEQEAKEAADIISKSGADGIILSTLMWCEDQIVRAALEALPDCFKNRLLICTFFPAQTLPEFVIFHEMLKGSGSVGSLQISGFLKREGYKYQSISGYYRDDRIYGEIREHCMSFSIMNRLKNTKCGVAPFRCELMTATYVDEFELRKLYGVELRFLELQHFKEIAQTISEDEINQFEKLLKSKGHTIEVDRENFVEGARYALAMENVIVKEKLDILAMNDVIDEMHQCFGLRPCLENPHLSELGIVVSMEGDIAAGIAMYILHLFTGEAPLYTEIFTADFEKNALLMGHAGYHNSINHDEKYPIRIISDVEYKNSDPFTGACTYFKYKPGPVTAVNCVYNGEKLQWTVFEGASLSGTPKMEGNCHLFCELNIPIKDFYEQAIQLGVTQHWTVVSGWHAKGLEKLCAWLDIEFHKLL